MAVLVVTSPNVSGYTSKIEHNGQTYYAQAGSEQDAQAALQRGSNCVIPDAAAAAANIVSSAAIPPPTAYGNVNIENGIYQHSTEGYSRIVVGERTWVVPTGEAKALYSRITANPSSNPSYNPGVYGETEYAGTKIVIPLQDVRALNAGLSDPGYDKARQIAIEAWKAKTGGTSAYGGNKGGSVASSSGSVTSYDYTKNAKTTNDGSVGKINPNLGYGIDVNTVAQKTNAWGTGEQYKGILTDRQIADINWGLGTSKTQAETFFASQPQQIAPGVYATPAGYKLNMPKAQPQEQMNDPAAMALFGIPGAMYGLGNTISQGISDMGKGMYDYSKSLPTPVSVIANADIGFGTAALSTIPFVLSVPYGATWGAMNPTKVPAKATEIGTQMVGDIWSRELESPGSGVGTVLGMYAGGKAISKSFSLAEYTSPIGAKVADIPSSSGASAKIGVIYTKPIFSGVETGTVRGYVGLPAMPEAQMIVGTKGMLKPATDIKIESGNIRTVDSPAAAKAFYDSVGGKEGVFYHATSDASFMQSLLTNGEFTIGEVGSRAQGKPLFFGVQDTVYTRFFRGGEGGQPGLLRLIDTPKSAEASIKIAKAGKTSEPGLYPGIKGLTQTKKTTGFMQEYIVPAGTKLSVKRLSYVESGGARIPVADVTIGGASILDKAVVTGQKLKYHSSNIKMPEGGFGAPTKFLKTQGVKLWNPLEEVPSAQWAPAQKLVMHNYERAAAAESGADLGLKVVASGIDAIQPLKETKFVQREPVGEVLVGKDLSRAAISDIYANREMMGKDVIGGGSTTIRANLAKGFFDQELIGDIDAWARADKVKGLWENEFGIVKKEVPRVVNAKETFLDMKVGRAGEGKFPVGAITKSGAPKPIVEIHSIEQFSHVEKPENIGTLETVGGHKTTGLSTGFLGRRKMSAMFDKQYLTQEPYGTLKIDLNPREVKHAVGASAIAREAASLWYGRDASITGMKPNYAKGMALEKYATAVDEMLVNTKGKTKAEVAKYQSSIKQNPLELPETKRAKAIAYAKSGGFNHGSVFGVDMGIPMRKSRYPIRSEYKSEKSGRAVLYPVAYPASTHIEPLRVGAITNYPSYNIPEIKTASKYSQPGVEMKGDYPSFESYHSKATAVASYPTLASVGLYQTTITVPDTTYPVETTTYTPNLPSITRHPTDTPTPNHPPPRITTGAGHNPVSGGGGSGSGVTVKYYPFPKYENDWETKDKRKLKRKQPYREIIPIKRNLFGKENTQDFERRWTILPGTNRVMGGFMPPEFNPNKIEATQKWRAWKGKGWLEAEYVEIPAPHRPYRSPPALGAKTPMHTVFKGTGGKIDTRGAYIPPVMLRPERKAPTKRAKRGRK